MKIIKLTNSTFKKLKNVLVWADLYDKSKNGSKNAQVFDAILKEFNYMDNPPPPTNTHPHDCVCKECREIKENEVRT